MALLLSLVKPLAYISLPTLVLRSIARSSPTARYYVRLGVYLTTLSLVGAFGALLGAGMSLVGRRYDVNFVVARTFYLLAGQVTGIVVEVEGEEWLETRPAVFMCNHQSVVDVLVLGRVMPLQISIMAKQSLRWSPLGIFMSLGGTIFVDRSNSTAAVRSMRAAGEGMRTRGTSLIMYPEGTRTSQEVPGIIPFKKGGFHLAIQAGIPIVPVVTENYWRLYHKGVFESGTIKVRVLAADLSFYVQVLPPVSTDGLTAEDVGELAIRVRDQMLSALKDISVKVPSPGQRTQSHDITSILEVNPSESTTPSSSGDREGARDTRKKEGSEGTETEEEEGMVMVGRP